MWYFWILTIPIFTVILSWEIFTLFSYIWYPYKFPLDFHKFNRKGGLRYLIISTQIIFFDTEGEYEEAYNY